MEDLQNRQKMSGFLDGVRISEFRETTERDFLTKSYYNTVHFLLIKSGSIKCTIHKAEYDCKGGDVFVSNLFESYAVQILSPVSGFSVVIEQDYLLGITSGEKLPRGQQDNKTLKSFSLLRILSFGSSTTILGLRYALYNVIKHFQLYAIKFCFAARLQYLRQHNLIDD